MHGTHRAPALNGSSSHIPNGAAGGMCHTGSDAVGLSSPSPSQLLCAPRTFRVAVPSDKELGRARAADLLGAVTGRAFASVRLRAAEPYGRAFFAAHDADVE